MKRFFVPFVSIGIIFYTSFLNAQSFTTSSYITIPGNNSQIDAVTSYFYNSTPSSFICWVNQYDSVYNIYLRQTSPDSDKNVLIFSDTNQIENPKIAFIDYSNNIRIVWQSYINNHWQILSREIINDTLRNAMSMTDSLNDNIMPALGSQILAWIQNGNLLVRFLDSAKTPVITLDSVDCSNPDVAKSSLDIVYEKGLTGNRQIYSVSYNSYSNPAWVFTKMSAGGDNINPNIGLFDYATNSLTYQTLHNGVWKIVSSMIRNDTTGNLNYNCENPNQFDYLTPIPVYQHLNKTSNYSTQFFLAYVSDSLKSNKEIMLKYLYWMGYNNDTTINISNSPGDDYGPIFSFSHTDTTYVAVFWTHEENGIKDIWMARTIYIPLIGGVNKPPQFLSNYTLEQNYPNPFNPVTTINYTVAAKDFVSIKVYDVLGNEIATLVNEEKSAGSYSVNFNASKLSSGVYFYRMQAGNFAETKKLILMK
ncbi:MAG: T9SS type A sorting domain-containing protein [Ignavibacteriaceae bacterium]